MSSMRCFTASTRISRSTLYPFSTQRRSSDERFQTYVTPFLPISSTTLMTNGKLYSTLLTHMERSLFSSYVLVCLSASTERNVYALLPTAELYNVWHLDLRLDRSSKDESWYHRFLPDFRFLSRYFRIDAACVSPLSFPLFSRHKSLITRFSFRSVASLTTDMSSIGIRLAMNFLAQSPFALVGTPM